MFVGKCIQDLTDFPDDATGGPRISFQAYFYWVPKIVPKEHNGVLVRINDSSGTLFDDSFMRYQVQEKHRLSQLTAEIFIDEGLDSALNIDRESFNFSHPHFQFISAWTHNALRQVSNRHKQLLKKAQAKNLAKEKTKQASAIKKVVLDAIDDLGEYGPDAPAKAVVERESQEDSILKKRRAGVYAYDASSILPDKFLGKITGERQKAEAQLLEQRIIALVQVLDAYGLLEELEYEDHESLLKYICRIFTTDCSK